MYIGFITSPRKERYLCRTLESLRAAAGTFLDRVHVVVSPNFRDPGEDWERVRTLVGDQGEILEPMIDSTLEDHVSRRPDLDQYAANPYGSEWVHHGLQHNSDRLIGHLLRKGERVFMCCQDDLEFAPDAVPRMLQIAKHLTLPQQVSFGAVTFYTPYAEAGGSRRALWRYPPEKFYGDLAVMWRAEAAQDFLRCSDLTIAHDLEIARFFRTNDRWRLFAHVPCLVQHVGVSSARGVEWKGRQATTMNYTGESAVRGARRLV